MLSWVVTLCLDPQKYADHLHLLGRCGILPPSIFQFRVSIFRIFPLSPFPATRLPRAQSRGTRNQPFCRKTTPVSPLPATLTDTPSCKSFACHSYENTGGVTLSLFHRGPK